MAVDGPESAKPVPDPTVLTTEALARGLSAERDYTQGQIAVIVQRLHDMDLANTVLNDTVTRVPTDVTKEVSHLRELMDEKFTSVGTQFKERDTRSERESKDNKVAVDAAFAAQKEAAAKQDEGNLKAIDKSERATAETIKTNADLNRSETKALAQQVSDLKDRINTIESRRMGGVEQQSAIHDNATASRAVIQVGISIVLALIAIAAVIVAVLKP